MNTLQRTVPVIVALCLFIACWHIACIAFSIPEYLLPSPLRVMIVAYQNIGSLARDTFATVFEASLGFLLANVVSLAIAIAFCHSNWLERSLYPYIIALKSVPVVAMSPLLVLWLGYGYSGKIVMAGVVAFFPLVVNATRGLKAADPHALDLMTSLSATRSQILFKLRLPTAIPYIFSALKISSPMAVIGAIVAEMTGAQSGLGFAIMIASMQIDTPLMFAAISASSLVGLAFFLAVVALERSINSTIPFTKGEESHA